MAKTGTWDNVDDTTLGEDDFQEVKDAVSQLTGMWQGFGSVLGLSPAVIREIQATHQDPARCLDEVLERWLKEDYNRNKFPPPNWRQLVCAVQNTNGGKNPALAKKIAPLHPKKEKTFEHKVQISPKLQLVAPTIPPQVSPRATQQEEKQNEAAPVSRACQETIPLQFSCSEESDILPQFLKASLYSADIGGESIDMGNGQMHNKDIGGESMDMGNGQMHNKDIGGESMDVGNGQMHYKDIGGESMEIGNRKMHNEGPYQHKTVNPSFLPHYVKQNAHIDMDGGKVPYESYAPYNPGTQELKLSFGTFTPLNKQPDVNFAKYDMERFPHGIALIINNETFARQKIREGTDLDEGNLVETFRYLGYQVEVHRDKKKAEIEAIFDDMKARDHSMYDSFVCCLLTHGADGGYIYASDSQKLELNNLISKLNAASCQSLFGKPKLFFIQACRGKGKSPAVYSLERVESDSDTPMVLPNETDFFFGYATTPTMVAWRDLDNGSWYVNELCQTLCEHSSYADLTSMHEIVQRKIAETYEINDFKQTTENNSRLTKKVFFHGTNA